MTGKTGIFAGYINDCITRAQKATSCSTHFCDPAESKQVEQAVKNNTKLFQWGGYPQAERKVSFIYTEGNDNTEEDFKSQITLMKYIFETKYSISSQDLPSHRDFLGAIIAYGIDRSYIGDIIIGNSEAFVFIIPTISRAMLDIKRAGSINIKPEIINAEGFYLPEQRYADTRLTVNSIRLDAVIAECMPCSRAIATEMVNSGRINVNWILQLKPDTHLNKGDTISIRHIGRFCLIDITGQSRKGRTGIIIRKYL